MSRKIAMDKKYIAIIILSFTLVISGIGSFFLVFGPKIQFFPPVSRKLIIGTLVGPYDLDPIHSWDAYSNDVIEQVCEGLYQYNLSDPDLAIIPLLAADYGIWNPTATKLHVPLRQGVLFHDGTKFNASSVQWTFERINYFINASGMPWILNHTVSKIHSLYEFPNGTTILDPVNPVTINSEYNVTINLRGSYAILESLLCYVTAYMLSPASTPHFELVDTAYGRIVGTGPFVFDHYVVDTEVKFHRWDNYWREPAFFEEVTLTVINDDTTRNDAMSGHTIDYLIGSISSLFPTFDADPTITHKSDIIGLTYYYLGMNNNRINRTWRQAISYSINYTHILEELYVNIYHKDVFRSNGPLAPNFPMYDPTIQATTYNLTKARELVVSMGFGDMAWTDAQWQAADFQSWNYTYQIGNEFREALLNLLQDNLDLIGIEVVGKGWSPYWPWDPFPSIEWSTQGFFWVGWGSDYLSPFNMITPLFSNISVHNYAYYYNHDVEMWLEQVLQEPNAVAKQAIYSNILHQIVEIDMPHAFGYHPHQHYVHSADIHGVPYNSLCSLYIYPMYRVLI